MTALAEARRSERPPVAASRRRPVPRPRYAPSLQHLAGSLHVLTCGSVDDGKSTLIGRLLWDAGALHTDQRDTLERSASTAAGTPDFSLLVDGLVAEREQGITIDIAWRYFDTAGAPAGHHRQPRPRAVHAQHGDRRLARRRRHPAGRCAQRRQGADAPACGDPRPDGRRQRRPRRQQDGPGRLVGGALPRDRGRVPRARRALRLPRRGRRSRCRPCSATTSRAAPTRMPWYGGPHAARPPAADAGAAARTPAAPSAFPCRWWSARARTSAASPAPSRPARSQSAHEVVDAVGGRRARVQRIVTMGRDLERAGEGQAVVLQLDTDIDVSRGAVLASPGDSPDRRAPPRRAAGVARRRAVQRPSAATCCAPRPTSFRSRRIGIGARLDLATLTERRRRAPAPPTTSPPRASTSAAPAALDTFAAAARNRQLHAGRCRHRRVGRRRHRGARTRRRPSRPSSQCVPADAIRPARKASAPIWGTTAPRKPSCAAAPTRWRSCCAAPASPCELEDQWAGARLDASTVWLGLLTALSFGIVGAVVLGLF